MQDTQKVSSELQDGSRTTKEKPFIYKGIQVWEGEGKEMSVVDIETQTSVRQVGSFQRPSRVPKGRIARQVRNILQLSSGNQAGVGLAFCAFVKRSGK